MTSTKTQFNIDEVRKDFPILDKEFDGKKLVYLDSGATSQKPKQVIERMAEFMLEENATVRRGVYNLSAESTLAFDQARETIRNFINAKSSSEIIFTRGTTESINMIASSLCAAFKADLSYTNTGSSPSSPLKTEDDIEILISGLEHHANIVPWQINARRIGAEIKTIPILDSGDLDLETYKKQISSGKVKILALTHIANSTGTINPLKEMIELAHQNNIIVLVDGAQGIVHGKIDVQELDADFYVFSGHKIYGPTGIGVCYGKEELLKVMPPYHGGGEMIDKVSFEETSYGELPFKFEAGTPPIVEAIGLAEALDYIQSLGLEEVAKHESELYEYALEKIKEIEGIKILAESATKSSIISFYFEDIGSFDIGTLLNEHSIAIRTGHHCAQPVMERFGIDSCSRLSLALYNNKDDIDRFIEALKKVVQIFH